MEVNSDFRELLQAFNEDAVRYLIVGGLALAFHDQPRFTKDIDIWVEPTPDNAVRVYHALASFGAPLDKVTSEDFSKEDVVFQIGVAPLRVDVMTSITGVTFKEAYLSRETSSYGDVPVNVLGRADLIANKRATARPQDLVDLDHLLAK
jgi:hypothetical protein